jgi:NAD(P)-dependent dehydrogenase (short-subunit alcohol dehydrogenase family)
MDARLGPVTQLLNGAGVIGPVKNFEKASLNELQKIFSINAFCGFLCAREAIKG